MSVSTARTEGRRPEPEGEAGQGAGGHRSGTRQEKCYADTTAKL